ncbi:putative ATG8-interacting protein [Helianthus debilis subsp. tardiflorus]
MAEKDEAQVNTPRGADWEVVTLTASAYAASPGGSIPEVKHEEKSEVIDKDNTETSNALFMSGHFVYPPRQNENAKSEPEMTEIFENTVAKDDGSVSVKDLGGEFESSIKDEENWDLRKLTEMGFTENTSLNLAGKEKSIYDSPTLHSLHNEATMGALNLDDETSALDESVHSSDPALDSNTQNLPSKEDNHLDNHDGSGYTVWLKKQAVCFYAHAKETNTLWSVVAAAAVMGIVIIGHKWHQEKWQVFRHEWKSRTPDEKIRMMAGPLARFKFAIIGGQQHDFSMGGGIYGEL